MTPEDPICPSCPRAGFGLVGHVALVLTFALFPACGAPSPAAAPTPSPSEPGTVVIRSDAFDPGDRDADGIADAYDLCPALGEDGKGLHSWDGCPDDRDPVKRAHTWGPSPREAVEVTHAQIKISEEIRFAYGSATIDPSSAALLASIAQVMLDAPEIEFVEVAGHADDQGSDEKNRPLTAQRALSVVDALVKRGVNRSLLRAAGYSSYCPLDTGDDAAAKAKNRRVEFRILRRDGEDLEPKWGGCDGAEKRGMKPTPLPVQRPRRPRPSADAAAKNAALAATADPFATLECSAAQPKECSDRCAHGDAEVCEALATALGGGRPKDAKTPRADPKRAFAAIARACDLGRLEACPRVSDALRDGNGTPKDPKGAEAVLVKTCASGSASGCALLGKAFRLGSFGPPDETKASDAEKKACDLGDGDGCEAVGKTLWLGQGVKADRAAALDLFITACELGGSGCATLRERIKEEPTALRSRGRALVALHVACEEDGDTEACGAIAALKEAPGEYRPVPVCAAGDFTACHKACERGLASDPCLELGAALLYGTGVRRKPKEAQSIFDAACHQGSGRACAMSALVRAAGLGGAHEERVAVDEFDNACELGEPSGCVNLARMELEGIGTYRDEARAAKTFDEACTKGAAIACAELGRIAQRGLGAPADPARAASLFQKACAAGFQPACGAKAAP